ncbi:LysR substrate-binding domain-containing protein [Burkholderia cepacia]|uniref:Glycine cleavage system transcriptional activator n=1 Tax=Burkholderia cepacia GG4 TaxID=1009846 RepID=A0A9W3K950_BURCE|nr:Glycine cleavage system transcriptional activator [Burkholderia cepacia GG4]
MPLRWRFVAQHVDIGVRYGTGSWPGLTAVKLMGAKMHPVCSPKLLHKQGRLQKPNGQARETLIHGLSMDSHTDFPTWDIWPQKSGVTGVATNRGMRINNSAAVLQAAIQGHGIALARSVIASDDLATGRLVRLFPKITFASPLAYYVVYRADCSGMPKLVAFRDWLLNEATASARKRPH